MKKKSSKPINWDIDNPVTGQVVSMSMAKRRETKESQ
jgi:hypothetical protein